MDRIWDVFICEGTWVIIFQIAISIILLSKETLETMSVDSVVNYFNMFPNISILQFDTLIEMAATINITPQNLITLSAHYNSEFGCLMK